MFFVIDVADQARYKEALMYYIDILKYFHEIGLVPLIVVLIHKADPEFYKTPSCQKSIKEVVELFKSKSQDFDTEFFVTSIFDRRSLSEAFSQSILRLLPKLNALDTMLKTFIVDCDLDGALIFDENFFILGNAYRDDTEKKNAVLQAINGIYFLFEDLIKAREAGYELELNLRKIEGKYELQFLFRRVKLGDWQVYILLVGEEIIDVNAILTVLQRDYESMKSFFNQ